MFSFGSREYCQCQEEDDDHPFLFFKASLTLCRSKALLTLSRLKKGPQRHTVLLEWRFNPVPLCVQLRSFQQSRSNLTPRLPTLLTRTLQLNVKLEETPSPREYCFHLEEQAEVEFAFSLCQTLFWF